jgi:hypothetical protein
VAGELRNTFYILESFAEGSASLRAPFIDLEALAEGSANVLDSFVQIDALAEGHRNLRIDFVFIEALVPVPPEGTVSTALFPGSLGSPVALPGLTFNIHKRPTFSTQEYKGSSGVSVRHANMQYPIWEFDLTFEFLRDNVNSEFQTLCGFFLQRQGAFDTFLLKDRDDYLVTNGTIGTSDGVTTQFSFKRVLGGFSEKVGQVDTGNTIVIYHIPVEPRTIPASPAYTITVNHPQATSPTITQDLGVTFTIGGAALVAVGGAPAAGQYSVNLATGVYTFNAADAGKGVNITYRYVALASNYTVTLPNLVVFTSAPTTGTISADFQFFFNVKFQEDAADFNKFAETFWELQKITLETVPQ